MSEPWFFDKLEVGNYYGTTEYNQFFKCSACGEICCNDGMESEEEEPFFIAGFKCECGHEVTRRDVETWTRVPYDLEYMRTYRRKHGW